NDIITYRVGQAEVIRVASHSLDNLIAKEKRPDKDLGYSNGIFTLASVKDEWADRKQLAVQHVTLRPLQSQDISKVAGWLKDRAVRESFVAAIPEIKNKRQEYFRQMTREYFSID